MEGLHPEDVPADTRAQLNQLTLNFDDAGNLWSPMRWLLSASTKQFTPTARVFIAREGDAVAGWSIVSGRPDVTEQDVHLFVREDMRRRGIGKRLLYQAKYYLIDLGYVPKVYGHDERSREFYTSQGLAEKMEVCV